MFPSSHRLLVPGHGAIHKACLRLVAVLLAMGLCGACTATGPGAGRLDRARTIGLLDGGERGHFLRPAPEPKLRRAVRRPAGPANVSPYRSRQRAAKSIRYKPQSHRGAARANMGNASLRARQRIDAARAWLGTAGRAGQPFVAQVLRSSGQAIDLPGDRPYAPTLYAYLRQRGASIKRGESRPGDLVFFRNTLDLNGNTKPDDGVTFVAVVEQVTDERIIFVGLRAGRVRRMALSLKAPDRVRDAGGQVLNTRLVHWPGADAPLTAGRCFAAFARP